MDIQTFTVISRAGARREVAIPARRAEGVDRARCTRAFDMTREPVTALAMVEEIVLDTAIGTYADVEHVRVPVVIEIETALFSMSEDCPVEVGTHLQWLVVMAHGAGMNDDDVPTCLDLGEHGYLDANEIGSLGVFSATK